MELRKYKFTDVNEIAQLFYETIHSVNAKDYTKEQLNVWATGHVNLEKWDRSFQSHQTYVATENNKIVGFGDIDETGYLDRLFVHKDFQGKEIATTICNILERTINTNCIKVHASITAKSFFEKRGYKIVKEQTIERQGVLLTNYIMEKHL